MPMGDAQVANDDGVHFRTILIAAMLIALGAIAGYLDRCRRRGGEPPDAPARSPGYGSGPGVTSVRTGNRVAAVFTLAGDALKALSRSCSPCFTCPRPGVPVGVAAFLGHLFPLFHRFQGGGVATAAGVAVRFPLARLATIATFAWSSPLLPLCFARSWRRYSPSFSWLSS
jgi:hypothetical protein